MDDDAIVTALQAMGDLVKRLREHNGWTQAEMADACDVTVEDVERFERGEVNAPVGVLVVTCLASGAHVSAVAVRVDNAVRAAREGYERG